MSEETSGKGWNSPAILVALLAVVSNGGWAYLAMSREDTQQIEQRVREAERNIAVLAARLEYMRGAR